MFKNILPPIYFSRGEDLQLRKMKRTLSIYIAILFLFNPFLLKGQNQYGKTNIADLVLIYQGGIHRPMEWNKKEFFPYIVHKDAKGREKWLYDGFLFLEFKDGKGHNYAPGYDKANARKPEWEWLMERQFEKDKAFSALNQAIDDQITKAGKPHFKHKLVVGIPSPILNQKDWGEIDGKVLDFSKRADRIEAGIWYINKFLQRYKQENLKHLALEGFYWVDEDMRGCADILEPLGDYIRSQNLKFYWIPYWNAQGFDKWKTFKFDFAYLQPNHFFNNKIENERIDKACELAKNLGMGLEMEFDGRALVASKENKSDRLVSYIDGFKKNGVFENASMAYYEGGNGIYRFAQSTDRRDKELIDKLAKEIIKRKKKSFYRKLTRKQ